MTESTKGTEAPETDTPEKDPRQASQEAVQAERGPIARAAAPNPNMVKALLEERKQLETRTDLDAQAREERLRQVDESLQFYGHGGGDAPETDAEKLARKHAQPPAGAPEDDDGENARRAMVQGLLEEQRSLTVRTDLDDKTKRDRISQVDKSLQFYGFGPKEKAEAAEQRGAAAENEGDSGQQARNTPPKSAEPAVTSGHTTRTTKK